MEEEDETKRALLQNLEDAGFHAETVERYLECCACGDEKGKEKLLQRHRQELLEQLHRDQKRIDCLDYLIYRERKRKQGKGCPDSQPGRLEKERKMER